MGCDEGELEPYPDPEWPQLKKITLPDPIPCHNFIPPAREHIPHRGSLVLALPHLPPPQAHLMCLKGRLQQWHPHLGHVYPVRVSSSSLSSWLRNDGDRMVDGGISSHCWLFLTSLLVTTFSHMGWMLLPPSPSMRLQTSHGISPPRLSQRSMAGPGLAAATALRLLASRLTSSLPDMKTLARLLPLLLSS